MSCDVSPVAMFWTDGIPKCWIWNLKLFWNMRSLYGLRPLAPCCRPFWASWLRHSRSLLTLVTVCLWQCVHLKVMLFVFFRPFSSSSSPSTTTLPNIITTTGSGLEEQGCFSGDIGTNCAGSLLPLLMTRQEWKFFQSWFDQVYLMEIVPFSMFTLGWTLSGGMERLVNRNAQTS